MVTFKNLEDLQKDLIPEELNEIPQEERCPSLRFDDTGPYCSKDLNQEPISKRRRDVCNNASLKLYCLDDVRYHICLWFNGEPFE